MKKSSMRKDGNKAAGRPRDARTTQSILKAALELGTELGFDGLTVEGVAARAGVGKSTIYRRWPDTWSIVADAVFADVARIAPVQERATARESFRVSMRLVARSFRGHFGEILRPLIGARASGQDIASSPRRALVIRPARDLPEDRPSRRRLWRTPRLSRPGHRA